MTEPARPIAPMEYGLRFWIGVALGWLIIGFGIHSAFRTYQSSKPVYSVIVLIIFALVHDLIIAPAVIFIGLGLRQLVRSGPVVSTVVGVAIISALVTAFTWPEIRHYGKDPNLASSLQTLDYATGLLTVLGVVWAVAAAIVVTRILLLRHHRASHPVAAAAPAAPAATSAEPHDEPPLDAPQADERQADEPDADEPQPDEAQATPAELHHAEPHDAEDEEPEEDGGVDPAPGAGNPPAGP